MSDVMGQAILEILDEFKKELATNGMTEHAEMLWHTAVQMRRERKPPFSPDEELPAMLRPQAM